PHRLTSAAIVSRPRPPRPTGGTGRPDRAASLRRTASSPPEAGRGSPPRSIGRRRRATDPTRSASIHGPIRGTRASCAPRSCADRRGPAGPGGLALPLVDRRSVPQLHELVHPVLQPGEMLAVVLGARLPHPLVRGLARATQLEPRLEHPGAGVVGLRPGHVP